MLPNLYVIFLFLIYGNLSVKKEQIIAGSDFDGVIVRDIQTMSEVLRKQFLIPDTEFWEYRRDFLKQPRYVSCLRPAPGVLTAIPIISSYVSEFYLISARQEYLREPIKEYLKQYNRLQYFNDLILRSGDGVASKEKVENIKKAGVSYMMEDDPDIAHALEEAGVGVLFIDGLLNSGMVNSPGIRVYEGMWDLAWDLVKKGSFRNIFAHHRVELLNMTDPRKIHTAEPPCRNYGVSCSKLRVCFPRNDFFDKADPYQAVAV